MAPHADVKPGFDALRRLVIRALDDAARATSTLAPLPALTPALASAATPGASPSRLLALLMATVSDDSLHADIDGPAGPAGPATPGGAYDDSALATSSEESATDRQRLIALVELARKGDVEAFGLLYDHYQGSVYRFLFHRTRSATLAEDLTSETFFRALRSMQGFRWQGKDFGAWLMTIARNLATDHFKAGRTRLEMTTEDMGQHDDATEGPEAMVLAGLTNEILLKALTELPDEQRDCLVMRFLQGMSIAETAAVLGRSDGAIKQLQLRGVRNLAKLMPEGLR
ncbi:sigma-70 family RNA polymerase sigma factor [Nocardioides cremeus]|jgi:RNA polymerase sigma-70 factor (ECF subfamily)|uniref:Sigma-70 family RNA polymerase sigma factor n=1 Tax=Nocardioides cremeus TaxID=3058044 RepID=A0ABT8TKK4_9ACTN|nr:sigma-70 family RNA polymerase sigma factor [Nocardioides cremeus]MDO3394475.1 sigma-70 family RNA polymerase sigma factor [Nocardioides cremeus]